MKKKEEEELADKADEILRKILSKDAMDRLTFTESNEPRLVRERMEKSPQAVSFIGASCRRRK